MTPDSVERAQWLPDDRLLCGARIAIDPWHALRATVVIRRSTIHAILPGDEPPIEALRVARRIDLRAHLILPGLINAHDHMQFGVFPRLGHGPYPSWREWAAEIYKPDTSPVRSLLAIPKEDRLWWGIIRNLLSGVTTVCNHDPSHPLLEDESLPIYAHAKFGWAHSLDDADWKDRYRQTPIDWPFILHCAEGLDAISRREATKLSRTVALDERLVLVHGVGISARDWARLRSAGVWIVWCPSTNLHILGRTLTRELLLNYSSIALGSDSPISSAGDLLDELHFARDRFAIPPEILYKMVTTRSARLLRLSSFHGSIAPGGPADLLILHDAGHSPCETLASLRRSEIAAVLHKGEFVATSAKFQSGQDSSREPQLSPIARYGLDWRVAAPAAVINRPFSTSHDHSQCAALRN